MQWELMDILNSEGVLAFGENYILLQTVGETMYATRAPALKEITLAEMAECIMDVHVDCLQRTL